jgi:hypothetical protein
MAWVHWGWVVVAPAVVGSGRLGGPTLGPCDPTAEPVVTAPAALIPEEAADRIRRRGDLVCHLIVADPAPRAKVAVRGDACLAKR